MPGAFASLDTGFPNLNGGGSVEAKLRAIQDYLYQLLEQTRYAMNNLGAENFNENSLKEISDKITEPIEAEIRDVQGNVTQLELDAKGFRLEVGKSAPEWVAGTIYVAGDIVKVTASADEVTNYRCKTMHTAAAGNKPPSTYWDEIDVGNVISSTFSQTAEEIALRVTQGQMDAALEIQAGNITSTVAGAQSKYDTTGVNVTKFGYGAPTGTPTSGVIYLDQETGYYYTGNGSAWIKSANPLPMITTQLQSQITQLPGSITSTVASAQSKYDTTGVNVTQYGYGAPTGTAASGTIYLDQATGYYYTSNGSAWTKSTNPLPLITTQLQSQITQTADNIRLDVKGDYAPTWVGSNTTVYYPGDVRKVVTGSGVNRVINFYRCDVQNRGNSTNKPGSGADWQDYWTEIDSPNVESVINASLTGLTLSYDAGQASANTPYITLNKDGTTIGGGPVYIGELDAGTITTGTMNAGNINVEGSFTVRKTVGDTEYLCGSIGGVAPNGEGEISLRSPSGRQVRVADDWIEVTAGTAEIRLTPSGTVYVRVRDSSTKYREISLGDTSIELQTRADNNNYARLTISSDRVVARRKVNGGSVESVDLFNL